MNGKEESFAGATERLWENLRRKLEEFYAEHPPQPVQPSVERARGELRQAERALARIGAALATAATCPGTRLADELVRDAARDATFALGSVAAAAEALWGGGP